MTTPPGFDPNFDDTAWNEDWLHVPIAPIPPGVHPGGYRVARRYLTEVMVFDRPYRLTVPFDCRLLYDPDGRLWMSSTPQEHIMMYNNGQASRGHALVGGLGLGLYPQYAAQVGGVTRYTVIEHSQAVREIVEPTLRAALDIPLDVRTGDVADTLAAPVTDRYDTVFLDTWDTLDAAYLPAINRLRDLALDHLAPGGRVLLWGYRWIVRLFETACAQVLIVPPAERATWLDIQAQAAPEAVALLEPVIERFAGQPVDDLDAALDWCRRYAIRVTPGDNITEGDAG